MRVVERLSLGFAEESWKISLFWGTRRLCLNLYLVFTVTGELSPGALSA